MDTLWGKPVVIDERVPAANVVFGSFMQLAGVPVIVRPTGVRIFCISDTHGELPDIPDCDLLIIAGDITRGNQYGPRDGTDGYWWDWVRYEFARWAADVPARKIVAIAGNHDTCLEIGAPQVPAVEFLNGTGTEFEGMKIWGGPWSLPFGNLAFERTEAQMHEHLLQCPRDTDILLIHGPPYMCGDKVNRGPNVGSMALRRFIEERQLPLVCCGHIHEASGMYEMGQTVVINAARGGYSFDMQVRKPE